MCQHFGGKIFNFSEIVEFGAMQTLESEMEESLENHPEVSNATKKCANVKRVSRKDEKLLSTSAKHESSPQIR